MTGMKLLAMQQKVGCGRCRIVFGAEVCDIRNALFLVDHQVFDDGQLLSRRLSL